MRKFYFSNNCYFLNLYFSPVNLIIFSLCQTRKQNSFFISSLHAFTQKGFRHFLGSIYATIIKSTWGSGQLLLVLFLLLHLFLPIIWSWKPERCVILTYKHSVIKLQTLPVKLSELVRVLSQFEHSGPWSPFYHLRILDISSKDLFYIQILILNDNGWDYNGCATSITYSIQIKIREVRKYLRISFIYTHKALCYM